MVAHLGGRRFDGLVTGQSVHFLDHAVAGIGPQFRGGFECGGLRVVELRPHEIITMAHRAAQTRSGQSIPLRVGIRAT